MLPRQRFKVCSRQWYFRGFFNQIPGKTFSGKFSAGNRHGDAKLVKWRLLLPGASEPRLTELNPSGLQVWFFKQRYAA
jgi:hypothetical protein